MGCSACGSGGNIVQQSGSFRVAQNPPPITNCYITKTMLKTWFQALLCIKTQDKYEAAHTYKVAVNQMLGVIQSALNFPDNYCYYFEQLDFFNTQMLPLIVANVPECLNQ